MKDMHSVANNELANPQMASSHITNLQVSVIVPAYNAAKTITECVQALNVQEFDFPYEIIVVDDASSDKTAAIAAATGANVIQHENRRGAAASRNSGIARAKGRLICFTDADCIPAPDWIRNLIKPFETEEIVGCKGIYATKQKEIVARFVQIEYEDKYDLLHKQTRINFIDTYSAGYRRSVLVANDGFDEDFTYLEDQELSFRLAARGYEMVFQPEALVYHYHSNTLWRYFRKKFTIGYWKAQTLRRFPGRMMQDSHTPQVMKFQILLMALLGTTAVATLLSPWSSIPFLITLIAFLATTFPFLRKAWPKDHGVALASPLLLGARALALGLGYGWGVVNPNRQIGNRATITGMNYIIKRMLDIIGSLFGLLIFFLLGPCIALAIKIDSNGPVIFKQKRVGQEGRPFTIYKFRSMHANAEAELANLIDFSTLNEPVFKLEDDPRLTKVGRILRRWSLDELPQFLNVLKGEMSLVGPRPEEERIVAYYNDWHRRRLAVKPGITGPMQVNGRGDLPLDVRVQLEIDYIQNYSVWRDIVILFRTVPVVAEGIGAR